MYVCVCMCVVTWCTRFWRQCAIVCDCMYVYTFACAYLFDTCFCVCDYICECMHTLLYLCVSLRVLVRKFAWFLVYMCVCVYQWLYIYIWIYLCGLVVRTSAYWPWDAGSNLTMGNLSRIWFLDNIIEGMPETHTQCVWIWRQVAVRGCWPCSSCWSR